MPSPEDILKLALPQAAGATVLARAHVRAAAGDMGVGAGRSQRPGEFVRA